MGHLDLATHRLRRPPTGAPLRGRRRVLTPDRGRALPGSVGTSPRGGAPGLRRRAMKRCTPGRPRDRCDDSSGCTSGRGPPATALVAGFPRRRRGDRDHGPGSWVPPRRHRGDRDHPVRRHDRTARPGGGGEKFLGVFDREGRVATVRRTEIEAEGEIKKKKNYRWFAVTIGPLVQARRMSVRGSCLERHPGPLRRRAIAASTSGAGRSDRSRGRDAGEYERGVPAGRELRAPARAGSGLARRTSGAGSDRGRGSTSGAGFGPGRRRRTRPVTRQAGSRLRPGSRLDHQGRLRPGWRPARRPRPRGTAASGT